MVHALRDAGSFAASDGVVVDLHPTPEPARLEIVDGTSLTRIADRIDDGSAAGPSRRHAAADAAIARCVEDGIFERRAAAEFTFWTQADTVFELRAYISAKWKQLHFDEADFRRAEAALLSVPGSTVVVTERVRAQTLRRGRAGRSATGALDRP